MIISSYGEKREVQVDVLQLSKCDDVKKTVAKNYKEDKCVFLVLHESGKVRANCVFVTLFLYEKSHKFELFFYR